MSKGEPEEEQQRRRCARSAAVKERVSIGEEVIQLHHL
jgi:hypothetical protein